MFRNSFWNWRISHSKCLCVCFQ